MGEHRFSYPTVIELRRHVLVVADVRSVAATAPTDRWGRSAPAA